MWLLAAVLLGGLAVVGVDVGSDVVDRVRRSDDRAHAPIDESDPLAVGVRAAHFDLNDAVGYDRWEPAELEGTAESLRSLAGRSSSAEPRLLEAADLVERAIAEDEREDAVIAHRVVEGLERLIAEGADARRQLAGGPPG